MSNAQRAANQKQRGEAAKQQSLEAKRRKDEDFKARLLEVNERRTVLGQQPLTDKDFKEARSCHQETCEKSSTCSRARSGLHAEDQIHRDFRGRIVFDRRRQGQRRRGQRRRGQRRQGQTRHVDEGELILGLCAGVVSFQRANKRKPRANKRKPREPQPNVRFLD